MHPWSPHSMAVEEREKPIALILVETGGDMRKGVAAPLPRHALLALALFIAFCTGFQMALGGWRCPSPSSAVPHAQPGFLSRLVAPLWLPPPPPPFNYSTKQATRLFCPTRNEPPKRRRSEFVEMTSNELRSAAVAAVRRPDADTQASVKALLAPMAALAPCAWAAPAIPSASNTQVCGNVDAPPTAPPRDLLPKLASTLKHGACPPDRPVMLYLGLEEGTVGQDFILAGLRAACHVIAFGSRAASVARAVQTAAGAVGADGLPLLTHLHAYHNLPHRRTGPVRLDATLGYAMPETVRSVVIDDLFFEGQDADRPLVSVSGALASLRPHHVYVILVTLGGGELPAFHGMTLLLESPAKPEALYVRFVLSDAFPDACDCYEWGEFLFDAGYYFVEDGGSAPVQRMPFLVGLRARVDCAVARTCSSTYNGWFFLNV